MLDGAVNRAKRKQHDAEQWDAELAQPARELIEMLRLLNDGSAVGVLLFSGATFLLIN